MAQGSPCSSIAVIETSAWRTAPWRSRSAISRPRTSGDSRSERRETGAAGVVGMRRAGAALPCAGSIARVAEQVEPAVVGLDDRRRRGAG